MHVESVAGCCNITSYDFNSHDTGTSRAPVCTHARRPVRLTSLEHEYGPIELIRQDQRTAGDRPTTDLFVCFAG